VPGYALDPDAIKSYIKIGQLQETKKKWPAGEEWGNGLLSEAATQTPCQSEYNDDDAWHLVLGWWLSHEAAFWWKSNICCWAKQAKQQHTAMCGLHWAHCRHWV
jgi:hypothetical protein